MKPITTHPFTPDLLTSPRYFWNCRTSEELQAYYAALKERQLVNPTDGDEKALLAIAQNDKKVLRLIGTTVPTLNGWSSVEKCCVMAALVLAMKPTQCVEIGVWAGRSLFAFAVAAREIGSCKVMGIDAYNQNVSAENEVGANADWWAKVDHSAIEKECRSLLKNFQLDPVVELVVSRSDKVTPPNRIDIFHCDGSHTETATKDVERYAAKIPVGGIIIFDDIHWVQGGVLRAIDVAEDMGFVEAFRVVGSEGGESNDWSLMQRVK